MQAALRGPVSSRLESKVIENIKSIQALLKAPMIVGNFRKEFDKQIEHLKAKPTSVVIVDKTGINCSVTVCRYLMSLAESEGYHVDGPVHSSKGIAKGYCWDCLDCVDKDEKKYLLKEYLSS